MIFGLIYHRLPSKYPRFLDFLYWLYQFYQWDNSTGGKFPGTMCLDKHGYEYVTHAYVSYDNMTFKNYLARNYYEWKKYWCGHKEVNFYQIHKHRKPPKNDPYKSMRPECSICKHVPKLGIYR